MTADNVTWCPNIYFLPLCSSMYCTLQFTLPNFSRSISVGFCPEEVLKRDWEISTGESESPVFPVSESSWVGKDSYGPQCP